MEELIAMECKCCGARMNPADEHGGVIRCAYCGYFFTRPKKEGTPAILSFLRTGEHELDIGKFDEAYIAYQKAAELDSKEPEAYWGMALAQFKIQYLKDTVNNRLQPICHDISNNRFTDSKYFLSALRYATEEQRKQYESKGEEIDYIQGEFYKMQQQGLHYDCFLCVKVTGENGDKTEDYKDADYIYTLLQDKGFTPFFSERNIRNKTGADYEAQILYALKTAESMLVICRNEEYLQTPWVKNEYTRFLRLMGDEEKESDAITFVYYEKPIEKLPGKKGKIQGIDFSLRAADGKIVDFVEIHTPEARKRKEAEARKKQQDAENQQKALEAMREEMEQLKRTNASSQSANPEELIKLMREAQRQAEEEKRAKEEAESAGINNILARAKKNAEAGNRQEAESYYKKALDTDPACCEAWWGLYLLDYNCADESQIIENLDYNSLPDLKTNFYYTNAKKYAKSQFKNRIKRFEEACLSFARKNSSALKREKETFNRETEQLQSQRARELSVKTEKRTELKKQIVNCEEKMDALYAQKSGKMSGKWFLLLLLGPWGIFILIIVAIVKKSQAKGYSKPNEKKVSKVSHQLDSLRSDLNQVEDEIASHKSETEYLMNQRKKQLNVIESNYYACFEYLQQQGK